MKTLKFISYAVFALFLSLAINSCKGDTGPAGADGVDGQDGNANVQTFIFNDPIWDTGMIYYEIPELTSDVISNDLIISYIESSSGFVYPIPGPALGLLFQVQIDAWYPGDYYIIAYNFDGTMNYDHPQIDSVKVVIIESTSSTGGKSANNPKQAIFDELEANEVDINDYYDVCAYFGIEAE